jgi:hypothetical protein
MFNLLISKNSEKIENLKILHSVSDKRVMLTRINLEDGVVDDRQMAKTSPPNIVFFDPKNSKILFGSNLSIYSPFHMHVALEDRLVDVEFEYQSDIVPIDFGFFSENEIFLLCNFCGENGICLYLIELGRDWEDDDFLDEILVLENADNCRKLLFREQLGLNNCLLGAVMFDSVMKIFTLEFFVREKLTEKNYRGF